MRTQTQTKVPGRKPGEMALTAVPEEIVQTSFRLPRSRWYQLQKLSLDERLTVQSIIIGALEAEFAKRGRPF